MEKYSPDSRYQGGYVTFAGGPPCVMVESFPDECIIKSIIDGEQFMVQKRDLIDAEVNMIVKG